MTENELKPILEALIYLAEEPLTEPAILAIVGKDCKELLKPVLAGLIAEYQSPERGIEIKEIANGYKMATKAEHHEWARKYMKHHTPPTRLSLPALETLAVIAYKQPITLPEIQDIRGVNAVGVLKTLLDKNLVSPAGRKNVIGRPILYRTSKEFLFHFGLKNLDELPSLEEFEELAQSALGIGSSEPSSDLHVVEANSQEPPEVITAETVQNPDPNAAGDIEIPPSREQLLDSPSLAASNGVANSSQPAEEENSPVRESSKGQAQADQPLSHLAQSK